jgi:hypothetical protein
MKTFIVAGVLALIASSASAQTTFLRPQSTMTNANVQQIVTAVDGPTLTLKYKDGEKKIFVPADAPIVTYVPGDKAALKPGAKVFILAAKQADGTLQGRAWRVGRDGVTPPM